MTPTPFKHEYPNLLLRETRGSLDNLNNECKKTRNKYQLKQCLKCLLKIN